MAERLPDNQEAGALSGLPRSEGSSEVMKSKTLEVGLFQHLSPFLFGFLDMSALASLAGEYESRVEDGVRFAASQDLNGLRGKRDDHGVTILGLGDLPCSLGEIYISPRHCLKVGPSCSRKECQFEEVTKWGLLYCFHEFGELSREEESFSGPYEAVLDGSGWVGDVGEFLGQCPVKAGANQGTASVRLAVRFDLESTKGVRRDLGEFQFRDASEVEGDQRPIVLFCGISQRFTGTVALLV